MSKWIQNIALVMHDVLYTEPYCYFFYPKTYRFKYTQTLAEHARKSKARLLYRNKLLDTA